MAIHNKSHHNHALMSLNKMRKDNTLKHKTAVDFISPKKPMICLKIADCCDFLKLLPDESIQLICIDPPYNLELAGWDIYDNYIEWAAKWIDEAYRVLSKNGSMVIFGGIQFRDVKSGDLIDIIHHVRNNTRFKLINTIIWRYKNGMSAHRYFANRHEEVIWLAKSNDYFAGSGTVGRVCIAEGRHCLMCDSDASTIGYFQKHLEQMRNLGQSTGYTEIQSVDEFFNA